MRRVLFLTVAVLAGCGGSGGSDPSITLPAGEATIDASLRYDGVYNSTFVSGDGEATIVWSQYEADSSHSVSAQDVRFDLTFGSGGAISDGFRFSGQPSASRRGSGLALVWTDAPVEYPIGITLNESDVLSMMSWPPAGSVERANPNVLGRQGFPSIACLASGRCAVSWRNICGALERKGNSFISFEPAECATEMANGSYVRLFGADGTPASDPIQISALLYPSAVLASAGGERFVAIVGNRIQSWDGDELTEQVDEADVWSENAALTCVESSCVVANGGSLSLFDATDLSTTQAVVFQADSYPSEQESIYARDAALACDGDETCVVTWVLVHEEWDYDVVSTVALGVYARAFDVRSGRLGEPVLVRNAVLPDEFGALVASTGAGQFLLASAIDEDLVLQRLVVD